MLFVRHGSGEILFPSVMIDVLAAHIIVFFRLFAAGEAKVRLVFAVRVHLATLIRNVRARTAAILRVYHAFILEWPFDYLC